MNYIEFVSLVQKRAHLESRDEAERAIESTLSTLAERLHSGEAAHLADQLPQEISRILKEEDTKKSFGIDQFYNLVSQRESVGFPIVRRHARAVISVVSELVSVGEMKHVLDQLPDEYMDLFTFGADGEYREL